MWRCQPVALATSSIVTPSGRGSMAMTTSCFDGRFASVSGSGSGNASIAAHSSSITASQSPSFLRFSVKASAYSPSAFAAAQLGDADQQTAQGTALLMVAPNPCHRTTQATTDRNLESHFPCTLQVGKGPQRKWPCRRLPVISDIRGQTVLGPPSGRLGSVWKLCRARIVER